MNELIFYIHVQNNCFSYSSYVIFDYCLIILAMFLFFNFKRDIISANILLRTCGFNSDGHFMKRIANTYFQISKELDTYCYIHVKFHSFFVKMSHFFLSYMYPFFKGFGILLCSLYLPFNWACNYSTIFL